MTEQFRSQPDDPKQLDPKGRISGLLGKVPLSPEQAAPQGGGDKNPERQPLPSVLDILERKAQLQEDRKRVSQQLGPKLTRARRAMLVEYSDKEIDLGRELKAVHDLGTDRDRLMIDVYTTMTKFESDEPVHWSRDLVFPEHIRQFISRVAPMSTEELAEELRTAQATLERKTQLNRKKRETREANKGLSWAEVHEKELAKNRQRSRERRQRLKLEAEQQQQPTQVFPDRPKK
jgi:hypothetical protein